MKLMTIALAGALPLSSTFALAQNSSGGGMSGGGSSSMGGSTASGAPGSSVNSNSMTHPPGRPPVWLPARARVLMPPGSIGQYARALGLAQRVDIDTDRARLGSQPIVTYKR